MTSPSLDNVPVIRAASADRLWVLALKKLLRDGRPISPRGQATVELTPQLFILTDALRAIVTVAARRLNYGFMAAEAAWILSGSSSLIPLLPYNRNMARYSDDGSTLFGAYGPKIREQAGYVIDRLRTDPESRQAVLTIWRPSPPPTKDVPCTVSMQFMIRDGSLHCLVSMRSSDAWLGLPYDLFTFGRVQAAIAGALGRDPGQLAIFAGSSHLYMENMAPAQEIVQDYAVYQSEASLPVFTSWPSAETMRLLMMSAQMGVPLRADYETIGMALRNDPALRDLHSVMCWYMNGKDFTRAPAETVTLGIVRGIVEQQGYIAAGRKNE